jgi:hypothetical protein
VLGSLFVFVCSSDVGYDISGSNELKMTCQTYHSHSTIFKNYVPKPMNSANTRPYIISQARDSIKTNLMVSSSPLLTRGLDTDKKNEIEILSLNVQSCWGGKLKSNIQLGSSRLVTEFLVLKTPIINW